MAIRRPNRFVATSSATISRMKSRRAEDDVVSEGGWVGRAVTAEGDLVNRTDSSKDTGSPNVERSVVERQGGRRRACRAGMRIPFIVAISAVAAFAAVACHHDGSTSPTSSSTNGYAITVDSGIGGQTAVVGTSITIRVHVKKDSQPAPGLTVTWGTGTGSSGTVSSKTSTTDASGAASVTWTMGDTAGVYALTASTSGVSATITATAIGGVATGLSKVSPDSQAVVAGATTLLTARAIDKFGNPSPNISITWAATGGTLSATATTTGPSGNASVNFTTSSTPATYTITATAAGLGSVTFKVVGF